MKTKMVKKILALLVVTSMAAALVVGCGSDTDDTASDATSSDTAEEADDTETAYSGTVVLNVYEQAYSTAFVAAVETVQAMDKYADVEIVLQDADADYETTLPIKLAGGEQIDIIFCSNPISQQTFVDAGLLIPLDDLLADAGVDLEERYGDYAEAAYNDDVAYALPSEITSWVLYYNMEIFDEAGIDYPDAETPMTWDEYRDLAADLTSGSGGDKIYGGLQLTWAMYWYGEAIMNLGGAEYFYDADGLSNIEDPAFADALQDTYDMMYVDSSIPTYSDVTTSNIQCQAFFNGQYGMFYMHSAMLNWMADEETYPRDWEIGIAPLPVDEGTDAVTWGVCNTYGITPNSPDPELALAVLLDIEEQTAINTETVPLATTVVEQENLFVSIVEDLDIDTTITTELLIERFNNSDITFVSEKISGANVTDYSTIINEEAEKFLVQAQDLETTIANIKERGDAAITAE